MSIIMVLYTAKYADVEYTTVKPCTTFETASAFCETVLEFRADSLEPDQLRSRLIGPEFLKWSKNNPPALWSVGHRSIQMYITTA
jgi:hypothetical protein